MNQILNWLSNSAKRYGEKNPNLANGDWTPPPDVAEHPDLPYSGAEGAALYADVCLPADRGSAPLPVAVMVHGGGLFTGDRKINRRFCAVLAQAGFLVFSLEYRLLGDADARGEIADLCAGLCFAESALERFGGDPGRVTVFAESAGAFLSVYALALGRSEILQKALGCAPPPLRARALVCFSGMFYTARPDPIGMVYRRDLYGDGCRDRDFLALMDPEHPQVISALPPVLLTSRRGDFLRDYTLRFERALRAAGHPCALLYYPEGKHLGHAFPSLMPELPESAEVLENIIQWLHSLT